MSNVLFQMLSPVFVTVGMTQYVDNINLQLSHDQIHSCSLKTQSYSLKLCFRTDRSSLLNFPFVSLALSKPKQIFKKKSRIKEVKRTSHGDVNVNRTS